VLLLKAFAQREAEQNHQRNAALEPHPHRQVLSHAGAERLEKRSNGDS
jgi:hypothetical protein